MRKLLTLAGVILVTAVVLAVTVVALAPAAQRLGASVSGEPEQIDVAALDNYAVRSQVFAKDGSPLATLHGPENREPVALSAVPQPVIDAILAVEDADFYQHNGVNFRAITRAFFENVNAGGVEQGGSTITQQLVKNALLTSDRDFGRKAKEIPLAIRLEEQLTKDQILEKYLNTVYFGSGAYGVQAAAETYWGVDVGSLGYPEAAMLAALISNPVAYDPTLHPDKAYEQRRLALDRMVSQGKITRDDADRYGTAPLPVRRCADSDENKPLTCGDVTLPTQDNYFVEEVKQRLLDDPTFGATREDRVARLFDGGLRIYTTLDPVAQAAAEKATADVTPKNDKGVTAAMVSVENSTGAVRALVGGPGYDTYQYDVATLYPPGRQPGSSFKVFVLLTALEQGNLPFDTIQGGGSFSCPGCDQNPYKVTGPGGTLTYVTTKSSNGAFVRLGQVVGLQNVIDTAAKLGVSHSTFDPSVVSMPLGTKEVTPLEMASAYSAIPNGGVHEPAYFVDKIEDRHGDVVYEHHDDGTQAVSATSACYASQILQENVKSGTGTRAKLDQQAAAGKTGTTEENADAWFVGFTPYLTTAVWMGNPSGRVSMENLNGVANFGGTYPAMIWKAYNDAAHQGLPAFPFAECPKPDRSARIVIGQGNPFLNGWRFGSSGSSSKQPRSSGSTGRGATTTTTPSTGGGPDPTSPPSTSPPPSSTPSTTPGFGTP